MNRQPDPANGPELPVIDRRVLIVEDERVFALAVQKRLQREHFLCELTFDLAAAREQLAAVEPDLILLDMRLPDGSGLDFLSEIQSHGDSPVPVLVMSAYGEVEDAVSAMKLGAADYLKKPIDLDELLVNVEKVLSKSELARKAVYSSKRQLYATEGIEFIGTGAKTESVRRQIGRIGGLVQGTTAIAPTVLILGETGTGKDVVARLLHANSGRNASPFIHVDCASLPKDLIEAELFGHEKGAFTSAHMARTGLIEAAENGVLFLDEIGELPPGLQAKLLAVLERRTFRRVGTTHERAVAAWFIAATNRDVGQMVERGEFRADLFYRLNVLTIPIPSLRERGEDIPMLAEHFAAITAKRYGLPSPRLSASARAAIADYAWPGNVRELKHMIERAVLLCAGAEIEADSLAISATAAGAGTEPGLSDGRLTLDAAERMLIRRALERTGGNVSQAARELGVTRMALRYRIRKHKLGQVVDR